MLIRGVQPNDLQIDALGDLRILRKSIIHNGGLLTAPEHSKLKVLGATFEASAQISPSHDQMHKLFASMKQAVGQLILHHTGGATSAPDLRSIVDVAIQTSARGDKTI